jgi:uncharacterized protein (TIGR02145 family)
VFSVVQLNCNKVSGNLRYDNSLNTPLAGVPIHLKTLLGNIIASDTSDSSGYYELTGYQNGNYVLDASINYLPGGVNSTDALFVQRHFTSLITLSALRRSAGDVNGSSVTNGTDALLIQRWSTGVISVMPAGTFTTDRPTLNAIGNPIVMNMKALSYGDVNGSYNIPTSAPALVLDTVFGNGNVGSAVVRFTNPGAGVFERGVVWSSSSNPTLGSNKSIAGSGGFGFTHSFSSIDPNNIQYARAYARTTTGVYYSTEKSFTSVPWNRCPGTPSVTDIVGNLYHTVQIGNQCWTQSNLKVSKYRNGDNIPTGLSNSAWQNTTSGAYAIYNNVLVNDGLHGKLYNHYAVTDSRGLCPTGWHVPSDGEWNVLVKYLDPNADTLCNPCSQSSIAGGSLKSTATQPTSGGWNPPNMGVTNSFGFTALPGGLRYSDGGFYYLTLNGYWWSSSVFYGSDAWNRALSSGYVSSIFRNFGNRSSGFSVRCLKNSIPQVNTNSVTNVATSTALVIGELSSDGGDQNTTRGFCYSTTSNPTVSNDTTMNGTGLGVYTDTLQNLTPSTTYYVRAYATNSVGTSFGGELTFTTTAIPTFTCGTSTVSDVDNNTYNTVQIGTQCWTQSNLKTSKYRNGDNIPTGLSNSAWQNTTSGAYANYDNNPVNDGLYGKLYNHYTVTDSRVLCPTGWHVPSDGEWNVLVKYLDPNADTVCGSCGQSGIAGGAMKSTETQPTPGGWSSPNTGATNSSGFTALPGGLRNFFGDFHLMSNNGYWWCSSVLSGHGAWNRRLNTNSSYIVRGYGNDRTLGFSVRCLKD